MISINMWENEQLGFFPNKGVKWVRVLGETERSRRWKNHDNGCEAGR